MQIVIDIPDGIYDTIQADEMISREQLAVLQMHILNGAPLPKGHGRLIDADKIINSYKEGNWNMHKILNDAQTIVGADMRGEEE